jgi:hypothetical protein
MGCTVLEFHLAADLLTASQLRSEGIPLVIFDLLNLIVYPNLYRRSGAHMAKAVIGGLSVMGGADDAGGTLRRLLGTSFFLPRPPQRSGPLKVALNPFVAEDHLLGGHGAQRVTVCL